MIKRLLIVVFTITSIMIFAQRNSSSPYSFFGIGEDVSRTTVEQASMGGIGVALRDYSHLNFINPAANADLRVATYAIGGELSLLNVSNSTTSETGNTTSLRYIALGFPIGKKAGFSAGLQPLSNVGYSLLTNVTDIDDNITESSRFTGNGGTTKLYGSLGVNVFEGLALGIEGAFVFGSIDNDIMNQRVDVVQRNRYEKNTTVRGSQIKIGAQFKRKLKKDLLLNVGASLQFENELRVSGNETLYSFSLDGRGVETIKNTLYDRSVKGILINPLKSVIGVGVGKENKWYVGVDSEFQRAFGNEGNIIQGSTYKFESSRRTSIGGYYIPKINSISSYWDRVTYRGGLRFEKVGLLVDGTNSGNNYESISDFGINVGFGLPLPRQLSNINLGFEYGQKGTTNNNLIKESYFNVRLSLSLNSNKWFHKREID